MKKLTVTAMGVGFAAFLLLRCGEVEEELEYFGEMEPLLEEGKADSVSVPGLRVSVEGSATQVWEVRNNWEDTNTPAARQAGIAWPAESGLNWDQKYQLWVESLPATRSQEGYRTFIIRTPWGKEVPAPVLECAEVALFLRATFASWYNLPFYVQAVDRNRVTVYLGHFGWRTASGKYRGSPDFKTQYRDYSHMTPEQIAQQGWPRDATLRRRSLWGAQDDYQPFLGEGARAGAYFDEIFLNKRVGYFMLLLLANFGSINLADSSNTYNLKPEAIKEGDVLVHRWARRGIGHTFILKSVRQLSGGKLEAELASGSMPRRQPKWEDAASSKYHFTSEMAGGPGTNWEGHAYASLGGGVKRWRVAKQEAGKWVNTLMRSDVNYRISSTNHAAIAARPGIFEEILGGVSPEEAQEVLLGRIAQARNHLRNYPASCSARTTRERAFAELYDLCYESFGMTRKDVDATYRVLDDYVFAELEYTASKTCCWNSTTNAMYRIIMDYNLDLIQRAREGTCLYPVVFKNSGSSYEPFASYAAETGRAGDWRAWSEDEPCPQRGVVNDTEKNHLWTDFCEIYEDVLANTEYY